MKLTKISIAITSLSLLAAMASSAFAYDKQLGDAETNWQEHFVSSKSRAEVKAEVAQAQKQGLLSVIPNDPFRGSPATKSTRTREEVRAEAIEASRNQPRFADDMYGG